MGIRLSMLSVLVHHVVSHSRPASVRVTFVSFNESLLFCN